MTWWLSIPTILILNQWMPGWASFLVVMVLIFLTPPCLHDWWDRQVERCRYPAIITLTCYAALLFVRCLVMSGAAEHPPERSGVLLVIGLAATFLASWLYIGRPK